MKFLRPSRPEEALDLRKLNPDSYFLAGGTQLNSGYSSSLNISALISLDRLHLDKITGENIGSMATLEEIRINSSMPPALRESAAHVASRNIRNCATIGGNIGANRSSSDMIATLIAMDAGLEYMTETGKKHTSISEWIKKPDGLILSVTIPDNKRTISQSRFSRTKTDVPIIKAAAGAVFDDSRYTNVKIAIGCIAEKVMLLTGTSSIIEGRRPEEIDINEIKKTAQAEIDPINDIRASADYRRHLVNVFLENFITGDNDGD
ncbi:MAG: FAD binding domain-containing protein [Elusimicrobiota bacterium]